MADMLLGYNNVADKLTLSGGNWLSSMPLSNLQNRQQGVMARSLNLSLVSTQLFGQMPVHNPVQILALANHNLPLDAKHRLRHGNDPTFATAAYDSGWVNAWPAVYHTMDLSWEDSNWWDGRYTEDDRAGYNWVLTHILPAKTYSAYFKWEFDAQNSTTPYVQAGRLFMAKSTAFGLNMSYGATLGWNSNTDVQEAISGAEFYDEKTPFRLATFRLDQMTESVGMTQAFELTRRAGLSKEVLCIWDPADTLNATRRQFLGRLRSLSALEFPEGTRLGEHLTSMGFEVKELLP